MRALLFALIALFGMSAMAQHGPVNCLDFDGTNDYVQVTNNAKLNPSKHFSVEAWINADSWATNSWQNTIVSKDQWGTRSEGWVIRCGNSGRLSFNLALNNNTNWYEIISGPLMSTNKWYHVAGTYDGTTMRLYLNGKLVGTNTVTGTITPSTAPVKIGNIAMTSQSRYFDGEIDEVRVWDTTLTETSIRQYMCHRMDGAHPFFSNLVAHYSMDAGSGTSIVDLSGNSLNGVNNGATWTISGAHFGDDSDYLYPSSWSGKSFKFGHLSGDSLEVNSVSGNPDGIHIYFIDAPPNNSTPPPGVAYLYTTRYYGIFTTSGSNVAFKSIYYYDGYSNITNQGKLNYNKRNNNADTTWSNISVTIDTVQKTITRTPNSTGHFILGRNGELTPFSLISPSNGATVNLSGISNQTVAHNWMSSSLSGGTPATYKWQLDFDTSNFSAPLISVNSTSAGKDTTAMPTYGQIANIMTTYGINYGETMNAKWTVKAISGPVERYADQAFDIDYERGILSSDNIYTFSLGEPDGDSLVVYNGGSDIKTFHWQRANSSVGPDLTYTVQLAVDQGSFNNPLLSITADNNGKDTAASISDADIASAMSAKGIPNNNFFVFKWQVKAEIGSLISYSSDSNTVYIKREDDPFLGMESNVSEGFKIYPNPVEDVLTIKVDMEEIEQYSIEFLKYNGSKLFEVSNIQNPDYKINLSDIDNGIYLLKLSSDKWNFSEKIYVK